MRQGLLAQFTPEEAKIIVEYAHSPGLESQADDSAKSYIPAIAYMFGAGPYWKCYARLGFDPRQNPEYRMYVLPPDNPWTRADDRYQRTYFYIQVARNKAPVFATPEPGEEEDEPVIDKTSHEAWGAEQRKLIEEGKRPEFDHSYVFALCF
jgi:general transcription factor 3C polypeptide 5 (transcription factor C subunit 1)